MIRILFPSYPFIIDNEERKSQAKKMLPYTALRRPRFFDGSTPFVAGHYFTTGL